MGTLAKALTYTATLFACVSSGPAVAQVFSTITDMGPPVRAGAREPALASMSDGRVAMSWTEPAGPAFAVKMAIGGSSGWTAPRTAVSSPDLFVNWADFPSIAALPDGRLAVHWLMTSSDSPYSYDVNLALSYDEGDTWGPVLVPHRDLSAVQHGFASLQPITDGRLLAIWLDGRAYDADARGAQKDAIGNAMQLRATTVGPDGDLTEDRVLDIRTCTCCQTASTVAEDGAVLVAYRDRTEDEIRDISLVRLVDGAWSQPVTVHHDGWEFSGCPINGPAIDAEAGHTIIAWFTAANDMPSVNVAFSMDGGLTFGAPTRVDRGEGVGRVDALQLEDGSAIVSWVEWMGSAEALFVCRVRPGAPCAEPQRLALNEAPGSFNFPRMVRGRDGIYIAWTEPIADPGSDPEKDVTVRLVLGTLPDWN